MDLHERKTAAEIIMDPTTDTDTVLKFAEELLGDTKRIVILAASEQDSVMLQSILHALVKKIRSLG